MIEDDDLKTLERHLEVQIELGLSRLRNWLLSGLLANAVLLGGGGLLAFSDTKVTAERALEIASDNKLRLDGRSEFMVDAEGRIMRMEDHLEKETSYTKPKDRRRVPR